MMETPTPVSEVRKSQNPKSSTELVKEIAILELEVVHLEKYLLSLYRKAFDHHLASVKVIQKDNFSQTPQDDAIDDIPLEKCHEEEDQERKRLDDSSHIHRSHSSLSRRSAYIIQSPPLFGKVSDYSYHSMPLTLQECDSSGEASDAVISLSNHLSSNIISQVTETANWISEHMVKCISAICRELAANSVPRHDEASTAVSFTSSMSGSPLPESNLWSPLSRLNSSLDLRLRSDTPFIAGGYEEFSGPYSEMVEILEIYRDSPKIKEIEPMFQKFRTLVNKLDAVSPSKLKHEEKLAFWINVHNALVMHAFLVYGVPQIKLKRASLLLKVAYNVGGHTVSVSTIQNYILGRLMPHPGQWFHRLFHPRKKFSTGDERRLFELDRPEPLSYFALSCGSYSDPPVRVYTPKTVFQDLIAARGEYITSNYRIQKEQNRIILPKIVDIYSKDASLHPADLMGILEQILPAEPQPNKTYWHHHHRKTRKAIGWIPHNFSFRYQFPRDLFQ